MAELLITLGNIIVALILVGLNGFFVASEFAFVRLRESSVETLVEQEAFAADALSRIVGDLDTYLAVTQLGITVASIGLGWVGEPAVATLFEEILSVYLSDSATHGIAFVIAFSFVTFFHVVFGELAPKTMSIQETEKISMIVAYPMIFFKYLFYPGIIVFNGAANKFTQLLGFEPASETEEIYTEDEVLSILFRSQNKGKLREEEVNMIERVFEMDDMKVKEIMTPKPDSITLEANENLKQVKQKVTDKNHTRYPVIGEDGILGFVDVKDVFALPDDVDLEDIKVEEIMENMLVISESTTVTDALTEFKQNKTQIAAIIDEWGEFEGLITIEDVVEVIVGDIQDKYDTAPPEASITEDENGITAHGSVQIETINEHLDTNLQIEDDDIETIGGLVLSETGVVPDVNDIISIGEYDIEIMGKDNDRIETIHIQENADEEDDKADTEENTNDPENNN